MQVADITPIQWHVAPGVGVPSEIAAAAARGVPIVAHVPADAPLDGWTAELLEECAAVVLYGS